MLASLGVDVLGLRSGKRLCLRHHIRAAAGGSRSHVPREDGGSQPLASQYRVIRREILDEAVTRIRQRDAVHEMSIRRRDDPAAGDETLLAHQPVNTVGRHLRRERWRFGRGRLRRRSYWGRCSWFLFWQRRGRLEVGRRMVTRAAFEATVTGFYADVCFSLVADEITNGMRPPADGANVFIRF